MPGDVRCVVDRTGADIRRQTTSAEVSAGTEVGPVVDAQVHVYDAPGEIRFLLADGEHSLTVFPGSGSGGLLVLFTDASSGVTTYAANRSIALDGSNAAGSLVPDFNRGVNLPRAYTPFATCPLPPAENRLSVAIEAGELALGPR